MIKTGREKNISATITELTSLFRVANDIRRTLSEQNVSLDRTSTGQQAPGCCTEKRRSIFDPGNMTGPYITVYVFMYDVVVCVHHKSKRFNQGSPNLVHMMAVRLILKSKKSKVKVARLEIASVPVSSCHVSALHLYSPDGRTIMLLRPTTKHCCYHRKSSTRIG